MGVMDSSILDVLHHLHPMARTTEVTTTTTVQSMVISTTTMVTSHAETRDMEAMHTATTTVVEMAKVMMADMVVMVAVGADRPIIR